MRAGSYDCGNIIIQTDKPYYKSNEMITGKIYIRVTYPIQATIVEIEVFGKERGSWIDRNFEDDPIKRRGYRVIFQGITPVYRPPPEGLLPGDYEIPFEFKLPPNLPSSMLFRNYDHFSNPRAMIKYIIRARIRTGNLN